MMSQPAILNWQKSYGDRGMSFAECALGTFRGRVQKGRCLLLLNDVKIGDHHDFTRDGLRGYSRRRRMAEADRRGRGSAVGRSLGRLVEFQRVRWGGCPSKKVG